MWIFFFGAVFFIYNFTGSSGFAYASTRATEGEREWERKRNLFVVYFILSGYNRKAYGSFILSVFNLWLAIAMAMAVWWAFCWVVFAFIFIKKTCVPMEIGNKTATWRANLINKLPNQMDWFEHRFISISVHLFILCFVWLI